MDKKSNEILKTIGELQQLTKKTAAKIAELQFGLVAAKKMQSFHELLKKL